MRDPETPPHLRIKVANILAPYVHPKRGRSKNEIAIDDPYGFTYEPAVARALRDDYLRLDLLQATPHLRPRDDDGGQKEIEARIAETLKGLECPAGYTELQSRKDGERLDELKRKRKSPRPYNKLTDEEDAEEAHLRARVEAYGQSAEGRARSEIRRAKSEIEDLNLSIMRLLISTEDTPASQSELARLQSEVERLKMPYPDIKANLPLHVMKRYASRLRP